MALINCPECGRKGVSDTAESCPGCGYNVKAYFDEIKQKEFEEEQAHKDEERKRQAEEDRKRSEEERIKSVPKPICKGTDFEPRFSFNCNFTINVE